MWLSGCPECPGAKWKGLQALSTLGLTGRLGALNGQESSDQLSGYELSHLLSHGHVHGLHERGIGLKPVHCDTLVQLSRHVPVQGHRAHRVKLRQLRGAELCNQSHTHRAKVANLLLSFVMFGFNGLIVTRYCPRCDQSAGGRKGGREGDREGRRRRTKGGRLESGRC